MEIIESFRFLCSSSEEKNMSRKRQVKEKLRGLKQLKKELRQEEEKLKRVEMRKKKMKDQLDKAMVSCSLLFSSEQQNHKKKERQKRKNFWEGSDTKKDKKKHARSTQKKNKKLLSPAHAIFAPFSSNPSLYLHLSISSFLRNKKKT